MKRIIASLMLVLFLAPFSMSMDYTLVRFGLKASPSIAWLNPGTNNFDRDGVKLGFSYGLIIDVPFSRSADFSTGIFINHSGGKLSFKDEIGGVETDVSRNYSLSYLELPATIKMRTPEMGYFTYYGKFGLNLGFKIGAKGQDNYGMNVINVDDFDKMVGFLNTGLIIGVGTEYAFGGRTALMVGLTYNNGFLNVLKGEDYQGRTIKATASFFEVSLGVLF